MFRPAWGLRGACVGRVGLEPTTQGIRRNSVHAHHREPLEVQRISGVFQVRGALAVL
jgi:hypothetical protein